MARRPVAASRGRHDRGDRGQDGAARADALADSDPSVIADAIEAGGSSLRDYIQADGSLGYFQHSFSVYDREGEALPRSPAAAARIARIVQSGRSTFYCPVLPALG